MAVLMVAMPKTAARAASEGLNESMEPVMRTSGSIMKPAQSSVPADVTTGDLMLGRQSEGGAKFVSIAMILFKLTSINGRFGMDYLGL